jgi:predicted extracellular nuclease
MVGHATAAPDPSLLSIAVVQGHGDESRYQGKRIGVSGIVTGDFQDHDANPRQNLGGFYLQDEQPDRDPRSSDAIFVYDIRRSFVDVKTGDRVTVYGTVKEYFGETQLEAESVRIDGRGHIEPLPLRLPVAATSLNSDNDIIPDLEHLEGMLVSFPQSLTVTDLYSLERFGELRLSSDGRLLQFTNSKPPSRTGYERHQRDNAARSLLLDDGQRSQNPQPIRYLMSPAGNALRVGDSVRDLVGNLRYARGSGKSGTETWRIVPIAEPAFVASNPRPPLPVRAGTLRVASFNLLNYFSRPDAGHNECGPRNAAPCRGADSASELTRQRQKIIRALALIDADIVGLVELENNAQRSLQDITEALNSLSKNPGYAYVNTGTIGNDAIKTGFLYKPASVGLHGKYSVLDASADPRFDDRRNRPPLAQTFIEKQSGAHLTVIVNHFKSKGSDCAADKDPNTGDGQGNCNQTRSKAAASLLRWLNRDRSSSDENLTLLIGDFNAYRMEQPLKILQDGGYTNLLEKQGDRGYSFIYDGQSGALDHALASPSLARQVVLATEWHINADEAPVHDYNLEHGRDPLLFDADSPYRASDHDPLIIDLTFESAL